MKKHIKSGLVMIAAVLLMLPPVQARATILKYVRTAKHPNFTRIAFEFQKPAQFKEPVIDGQGKFTVVFPDCTTVLPRQIIYKKTRIQPVRSIEFNQQGTLLTAHITLSFPYFKLKTFSLSGPDRVVIDAYLTTPSTQAVVPEESLPDKPSVKESKAPEPKEPKAMPEESSAEESNKVVKKEPLVIPKKSSEKESSKPEMTQPKLIPIKFPAKELSKPEMTEPKLVPVKSPVKQTGIKSKKKKKTALDITQKQANKPSKQSLNRPPDAPIALQSAKSITAKGEQKKQADSVTAIGKNYNLQTYMLALLNFLTIVIILLLSINLLKKKSGTHSEHPGKIPESLKTVDESIAAIDAKINKEFKKHDES